MTDQSPTERIRAMLDERGANYREYQDAVRGSMEVGTQFFIHDINGKVYASIDIGIYNVLLTLRCTPEQAIAATLGGQPAKLTAEQVEKAIGDCSTYASYDGCTYYATGIRLQAIADELNAAMGDNADADDALALLDEIREAGRISYDDYSQLHDAISVLGSGTCDVSYEQDGIPRCSNCQNVLYDEYKDGLKNYCDECGSKIRKAVSA